VTRDRALDERRSGARHAEDQDGRLVVAPEGGVLGDEVAREPHHERVDTPRKFARVERRDLPSDPISSVEVIRGRGVVAQIVERLARCEVEHHPLAFAEVFPFEALEDPLQDRPVVVGNPSSWRVLGNRAGADGYLSGRCATRPHAARPPRAYRLEQCSRPPRHPSAPALPVQTGSSGNNSDRELR
jgi:hypothetical protein